MSEASTVQQLTLLAQEIDNWGCVSEVAERGVLPLWKFTRMSFRMQSNEICERLGQEFN